MIAEKRRIEILKIINEKSSVSMEELLDIFQVSRMTLWRDLQHLEGGGSILRVHGGAMRIDAIYKEEEEFEIKRKINYKEKLKIAKFAASNYIEDTDIIFLDGGTTVLEIIPHLKDKNITMLSNGLYTLLNASKLIPPLTVIGCGGILRKRSSTFIGPEAEQFFSNFKVNTAFISGIGFSLEDGIMDPHPLEMQIKKVMCKNANKIVALIDSSKFNKKSLQKLIDIDEIDVLITDSNIPKELLENLKKKNLDVKVIDV